MDTTARHSGSRWGLWVLAAGMFQVVIGSTLPSGLYAIYERDWDLSRGATTIVFAMYVAGVLISLLFLGHLADRIGRKKVIMASALLSISSSALFLLATGPGFLYAGRLLSGIAVGICTGAFTSALGDLSTAKRGAAISAIVTSGALAMGPLASAMVAHWLPFKLQLPFALHLVFLCVITFLLARLPETTRRTTRHTLSREESRLFATASHLFIFIICATMIGGAYGANGLWQSVVPLMIDGRGFSQVYMATLASAMLGMSAVAQVVTLALPPKPMATVGLITLGTGFIVTAYAASSGSMPILWAGTTIVGIGQGLSFRSSLSIAAHVASDHRQSTAISLYYIFGYVMTAAAPLATNSLPLDAVLVAMGAASLVSLVLLIISLRKGRAATNL
ncbi:hypothetical protein CFAL_08120 [Corynebacterium falsenii DSM 44353]|uniref:MFS transporter n=1 Tax=Corynebacterium falsenii TaxID=108486 RepID=UPI0003E92604|nr:MFS transporter [Corynebacterium falsenii]AHI04331.1 hypothetical protein CFAL_08120 [Corynebacterium falsenii DSM 44353]UBI04289.1 MFS transporter [Corynebacterium falsenii]